MTELKEFLSRYREEMPEWLKSYKAGDNVRFADFMSRRIGYYPGSGEDGCLVRVANEAHCVHCFLYVDYGVKKATLQELLAKDGEFRGYHSIGQVEWTEKELMPNGQYPMTVHCSPRLDPMFFVDKSETPYIFMEIFERDSDKDENWGAERFAVAFLFADGIATYYQLFTKEYGKAPWLFLLQDHGFGGNYDKFGKGGLLDAIMKEYKVYPDFVICPKVGTTIWDGYELIEDVAPVCGDKNHIERYLYINNRLLYTN